MKLIINHRGDQTVENNTVISVTYRDGEGYVNDTNLRFRITSIMSTHTHSWSKFSAETIVEAELVLSLS